MARIVTVVGARPQFIKAAALSPVLRSSFDETLIHTGQHYDYQMSEAMFDQLQIPHPDYNLNVGSGTHARQTAAMLMGIEDILISDPPEMLLTYGDTNSTLAAALAAAKLNIPVAHVEAGLRSFNRKMPEELNRVVTDDLSALLFCPTDQAVENLRCEGITTGVFLVGDVMCDALRRYERLATQRYSEGPPQITGLFAEPALPPAWYLATIHRAENTQDEQKLGQIIEAFEQLDIPVLFVTHPRTRPLVKRLFAQKEYANTLFIEPVGYLEMLYLSARARKIITDSGGLQKEAYMLGVPCVTVREQTEWVETLYDGWNILVDATSSAVVAGVVGEATDESCRRELYGDGHAAERITACLTEWL
ncbi:MAG: UDP-N-acetylglucosamine 2-epimerase (non-hydrolyzing) [Coriobacteriales bacterium]|jgi:UDP-N-acetylglucosamine 2-epimerase (non-hydrolysing)/UDP-GlcNAc3NAcA epimerase|nr:UDP-N-acetylglucosamine 2-epimerase (non-hydrolyzing) [Coriobacteriales bacterium]